MAGWDTGLSRSLVLRDGRTIRTLADARAFILKLPEADQHRSAWHSAVERMLEAAEKGGSIERATEVIERALFLQG